MIFSKEEWIGVFEDILNLFEASETPEHQCYIAEAPVAYTRYGDRDIFTDKIHVEHSNKGYRSQHYIIFLINTIVKYRFVLLRKKFMENLIIR